MAPESRRLTIARDSRLANCIEDAATKDVPLLLDTGEAPYEISARRSSDQPVKRRRHSKVLPVTEDDALFRLIGSGESHTSGDPSERKHESLARGYRAHHSR